MEVRLALHQRTPRDYLVDRPDHRGTGDGLSLPATLHVDRAQLRSLLALAEPDDLELRQHLRKPRIGQCKGAPPQGEGRPRHRRQSDRLC